MLLTALLPLVAGLAAAKSDAGASTPAGSPAVQSTADQAIQSTAAHSAVFTGRLWTSRPHAASTAAAASAPAHSPVPGEAVQYCNSTLLPDADTQLLECNADLGDAPFDPNCSAHPNLVGGRTYACPLPAAGRRCAERYEPTAKMYRAQCDWPALHGNPNCKESQSGASYTYECAWEPRF